MMAAAAFQQAVLDWFDQHGRHDLPWQQHLSPYRVWVSEIMLQQTQVSTVIPYYQRFMDSFPDVQQLAAAELDQVLHHWTGLGYYARARNLHKAARTVVEELDGEFPDTLEAMQQLPGIGRSTAGAILAISAGLAVPILDGNVKRVLARFAAVPGWSGKAPVLKRLWQLAEHYTPQQRVADYTQAMMDLGATLCTRSRPDCPRCPLSDHCLAYQSDSVPRYPEARPKKTLPLKETWMLLLRQGEQQVLLQQRPPSGIWGGLWCFPEFASEQLLRETAAQQGLVEQHGGQPPPFTHTFSHYQLRIFPRVMTATGPARAIHERAPSLWCDLKQPAEVGLAAPVKRLLGQLAG